VLSLLRELPAAFHFAMCAIYGIINHFGTPTALPHSEEQQIQVSLTTETGRKQTATHLVTAAFPGL